MDNLCGNTEAEKGPQNPENGLNVDYVYGGGFDRDREEATKFIKKMFVKSLMVNKTVYIKKQSGDMEYDSPCTLNDAISAINKNSELWEWVHFEYDKPPKTLGEIFDEDPDFACEIIGDGKLPTEFEKIVKKSVEIFADEVFGNE